jgi:parallel beta-helix repeat protein
MTGSGLLVRNCTVVGCAVAGIVLPDDGVITNNNVRGNDGPGIRAGFGCTVIGNTTNNNRYGISVGPGCTVIGNTAISNQREGIDIDGNCLIDQNTAIGNDTSNGGFANISACADCTFGLNHAP